MLHMSTTTCLYVQKESALLCAGMSSNSWQTPRASPWTSCSSSSWTLRVSSGAAAAIRHACCTTFLLSTRLSRWLLDIRRRTGVAGIWTTGRSQVKLLGVLGYMVLRCGLHPGSGGRPDCTAELLMRLISVLQAPPPRSSAPGPAADGLLILALAAATRV